MPDFDFTEEQSRLFFGTEPEDTIDWIENLLTIDSEQGRIVDFKLYPQQKQMVHNATGRDLTVKGRQTRASSVILAKNLRRMTTEGGLKCLIMTNTDQVTNTFRERIRHHFRDLKRAGFNYTLEPNNDNELGIKETESYYMFGSGQERVAGRAYSAHIAHLSEFAHWPQENAHTLLGGISPAVPGSPYGWFDIESTPNGAEGQFYDEIMESQLYDKDSRWMTHFYPWWLEPRYRAGTLPSCDIQMDQEKWEAALIQFRPTPEEEKLIEDYGLDVGQILWRRITKNEQDRTDAPFLQEFPETIEGCFLTAGGSYFASPDGINHLEQYRGAIRPTVEVKDSLPSRGGGTTSFFGPNLHIWQLPQPGQPYVIWADNAGGGLDSEADFSAIGVMNVSSAPHWVARVNIKVSPDELAPLVVALATFYNEALVGGERDHYGEACLRRIREIGYSNLWYYMDPKKAISMRSGPVEAWGHPNQTRTELLNSLRQHVFQHTVDIADPLLIQQMGSFTWQKEAMRRSAKAKAEKSKKDDLVIVAAGCCYIAGEARARYNAKQARREDEIVVVGKHGLVIAKETSTRSYSTKPWLR